MTDFIKIDREILQSIWNESPNTCRLYTYFLLKASTKGNVCHGIELKKGQFISSYSELSKETGLTVRQLRTCINDMETTKLVTRKRQGSCTLFSVLCEWSATSERQSKRQGNDKEVTEPKEEKVYYPYDEELNQAFADFVEMRKRKGKPNSEHTIEIRMARLQKLATPPFSECMDNDLAVKIVRQSVDEEWLDFYKLKEDRQNRNNGGGIDWSKA